MEKEERRRGKTTSRRGKTTSRGHKGQKEAVGGIKRLAEEKKRKEEERRKEQRRIELEKIALNPGFRDLTPGLTSDEIKQMKVCGYGGLSSGSFSKCYDMDNMKFQGKFRWGVLRVLRIDMGPVVQSRNFLGRLSDHVGDGDIIITMRRRLSKYEIEYQFSERDLQMFNEREKDKLYVVYEKGQVALVLAHIEKSTYDRDIRLFVEYRDPETAKNFLEINRPKKAKSSDF